MMHNKKIVSAIFLSAGLLLSVSSFAATTWKMAVGDGGGSAQEALGLKFSELLAEKTANQYVTKLFVNGQLGTEQATVNDVSMDLLELSIIASNNLSPFSPSMDILSLPYIFENVEQAQTIVEGSIGQQLIENTVRDANVRVLAWTYSGYRIFSNSKRPVKNLTDLQGLVVRVPKSEIIIDTYRSWGINPTPMAWAETFTALQQRVVDGQDSPYAAFYATKFGEIQQYLTETHYQFLLEPLIISESLFQQQSPEVKKVLLEAGREATTYSLKWLQEKEADIVKVLIDQYGVQIDTLNDKEEWIEKAQHEVWPKFYEKVGGKEKVNELLRVLSRQEI